MTRVRFDGAVLAGGGSVRMGRDKAVLAVDGHAMAARVAVALVAAGASAVWIVGGPEATRRGLGTAYVPDRYPGEGPLGGLLAALAVGAGEWVAVAACDLPWLDEATIAGLLDATGDGVDVVFARTDRREPLCAVWRRQTAATVLQRAFDGGERAIHRSLDGLRVREVAVDVDALTNVNTPDDLAAARAQAGARTGGERRASQ